MRFFVPGFIVFILYALLTRWVFVCEIRGNCVPIIAVEEDRVESLALWSEGGTILEGYEQFRFDQHSASMRMTTDNRYFLEEVAGYLRRYTQRDLRITGYYLAGEPQSRYGRYDNLGQARAATVSRWLVRHGVPESRILLDFVRVEADSLPEPVTFHIITDND